MKSKTVGGNNSGLIAFLYELLRDHLPTGVVERLVNDSPQGRYTLTNGYLADYAVELSERLFYKAPPCASCRERNGSTVMANGQWYCKKCFSAHRGETSDGQV